MLAEMYIRDLAVIEETRIVLKPGLTVLSGEEGAGKSLIVDALCLLLGGRASTTLIRTGASAALVEGIFWIDRDDDGVAAVLHEAGIETDADGSLIISREVQEQGRSVARVNGRAVPVSLLRDLGHRLIDIHSQMEHLSLLNSQRQMDILDSYAGLLQRRESLAGKIERLQETARELSGITGEDARRRRELLSYQVAEIEAAGICQGEDETLQQERLILQRAQTLKEECYRAYGMLYEEDRSAATLVHTAAKALQGMASIDPSLQPHLEALESAQAEIEQTARDLHHYADAVSSRSERLAQIEDKLELLRQLKSKYGPTIDDVIEFAHRSREELQSFEEQEERRFSLETELSTARREVEELAIELSAARQEAAQGLTSIVNGELADLGMPWARFDISVRTAEQASCWQHSGACGICGPCGIDRVEYLASTNPGEPLKPLAEIASGGETCRFMIALKSGLQSADWTPLLVFDEIDMGIGGRSAHIVGKRLAALARNRQVICITHLPQIACYAHNHYKVTKDISSGHAASSVEHLDAETRLEELAAMLGSKAEDSMLMSASDLLKHAEDERKELVASRAD